MAHSPRTRSAQTSRIPVPSSSSASTRSYRFSIWSHGLVPGAVHTTHKSLSRSRPETSVVDRPCVKAGEPPSSEQNAEPRVQLRKPDSAGQRYRYCQLIRYDWSTEFGGGTGMFVLDSNTMSKASCGIGPYSIKKFCNKPTAFYWARSAQTEWGTCQLLPFYCLFQEWFRWHGKAPLQCGHFLANPIHIAESGPDTIESVVQAHRALCSRVRSLLEWLPLNVPGDSDWPSPEYLSFLPLYEAVILLFDDYGPEEHRRASTDELLLDEKMQRRNVLIILIGNDERLSRSS